MHPGAPKEKSKDAAYLPVAGCRLCPRNRQLCYDCLPSQGDFFLLAEHFLSYRQPQTRKPILNLTDHRPIRSVCVCVVLFASALAESLGSTNCDPVVHRLPVFGLGGRALGLHPNAVLSPSLPFLHLLLLNLPKLYFSSHQVCNQPSYCHPLSSIIKHLIAGSLRNFLLSLGSLLFP